MNAQEVSAYLDGVLVIHLQWRPTFVRNVAVQIVSRLLQSVGPIWPDDIDLSSVPFEGRNCVGTAWRMLAKYKMIEKTGPHRKSKSDDAKGREIFQYRLVSKKAAAEFVRVSGALPLTSPKPAEKQSELFA